jgi:hypothetical protein
MNKIVSTHREKISMMNEGKNKSVLSMNAYMFYLVMPVQRTTL